MGVTIHYEGVLRNAAAGAALIETVAGLGEAQGWPVSLIDEAETRLTHFIAEVEVEYVGPSRGVELQAPGAEPLRFEFGDDRFVQDFCKTQFAGVEVHAAIVELLRTVAPLFEALEVFDEGELWETGDAATLVGHFERIDDIIADMKRKDPAAEGPIRLESGRIVDLMEGPKGPPSEPRGWKKLLGLWRR